VGQRSPSLSKRGARVAKFRCELRLSERELMRKSNVPASALVCHWELLSVSDVNGVMTHRCRSRGSVCVCVCVCVCVFNP